MENKPIRVAQILGKAVDGGVESVVMNYYKFIDKSKVQFDIFIEGTSNIVNEAKIKEMGGNLVIIPSYKNPIKYVKTLKKLFKEGNYDIVHSNMNTLAVFSLYAAKKAGIKIRIAHSHSTTNKKEPLRNMVKNILKLFSKRYATTYFGCSELAGRWLFGEKAFNAGKVTVIPNAIDLDRFKYNEELRNSTRKALGISDEFVLGHVGRFVSQKNHTYLIDIFNSFKKLNSNSKLLLVGEGKLEEELHQKVKELGLENDVIFVKNNATPEAYYQAMDSFVLPSLYEGLPLVGNEAQVSGLNSFIADTVTKELKVNENLEFISLDKTPDEWAKIIFDYKKYDRNLGYQNYLNTKFDLQANASKLSDIYVNLVENHAKTK